MSELENDARLQAIIRDAEQNARTNPAVLEDTRYMPWQWTEQQTAKLVRELHGTEAERLDRLIAELNQENRRI